MKGLESNIKDEYDLSQAAPNRYACRIKRPITVELYPETISIYRNMAEVRETCLTDILADTLESSAKKFFE